MKIEYICFASTQPPTSSDLNEPGAVGWELVSVVKDEPAVGLTPRAVWRWWMKRQAPAGDQWAMLEDVDPIERAYCVSCEVCGAMAGELCKKTSTAKHSESVDWHRGKVHEGRVKKSEMPP
jgi:hypothetical protein